ncbi:MAG: hypothetical protein WC249_00550 [Patescibacteria group bacterium]|jgi:hypothetical protein
MFNKKSKIDENPELTNQVSRDLIVHNMPNKAKISGTYSSKAGVSISSGFKTASDKKNNFKAIGLIIMILGLIIIGGLIYFGYIFIIKSATNQNNLAVETKTQTTNDKALTTSASPASSVVATATSGAAAATSAALDLATITAVTTTVPTISTTTPGEQNISRSLSPLVDSDNDGLNDLEEEVFGLSATSSDTNNNGYTDLTEINSNYNPGGSGRLNMNTNLETYTNKIFNYQLLYPKTWPQQSLNNDATVIFTAPDNSLIQISVQNNSNKANILNWYEALFPNVIPGYDRLKSINNWEGIMSEDNLNFYLTDKTHTNIFVISYITASVDRIAYPNVFNMIINSLVVN